MGEYKFKLYVNVTRLGKILFQKLNVSRSFLKNIYGIEIFTSIFTFISKFSLDLRKIFKRIFEIYDLVSDLWFLF